MASIQLDGLTIDLTDSIDHYNMCNDSASVELLGDNTQMLKSGDRFVIPEERQLAYEHTPVQAGSEADKAIMAQLAELRRVAV